MIDVPDVPGEVMRLRQRWIQDNGPRRPKVVYLPTSHAEVLLLAYLDRADDEERERLTGQGVEAVYGGTIYGMEIRRTDDLLPCVE